ncbi:hypothetical protein U1769_00465 [Sphingomonas sp. ZT3P38]|uniref:hypothetical protein n=1 Tax=Parasphingomonas zepuensis TaxID=3096161 RepID=UPI002FCB9F6D
MMISIRTAPKFERYFISERLPLCISGFCRISILLAASISAHTLAQLPPPPKGPRIDANGVDVKTGNPVYSRAELDIGPPGENGLHLARYLSGGIFRDSFDSTYLDNNIMDIPESISASFGPTGDSFGSFGVSPGAFIFSESSGPIYKQKNGTKVTFGLLIWDQYGAFGDNSEQIYRLATSVSYGNGVVWTIHYKVIPQTYYPVFRIQSVTTNTGYQIKFTYESNNVSQGWWGRRVSAKAINNSIEYCDPDADSCALSHPWPTASYAYTSSGSPTAPPVIGTTSVTDATGGVTVYRSTSGPSSTLSITNPDSAVESIKYLFSYLPNCVQNPNIPNFALCSMGSDYRVTSAILPDKTTNYAYNISAGLVTSTEPGGIVNRYYSQNTLRDGEYALVQWIDPLNHVYNFQVNQDGLETQAQWPELNYVSSTRDAAGNVLDETAYPKPSGGPTLARHQTFDPCTASSMTCDKPRTITDPRGNVTAMQYNANGQMVSEVGPPDSHNIRTVKLFTYADLYAYVKNSAGSLVAAASPVSMLTSETMCEGAPGSSAAACSTAPAAVKVVTTYEYGAAGTPNTLLRRAKVVDQGPGKLNLRTCYSYDDYGNNISETAPRAGLTSCP